MSTVTQNVTGSENLFTATGDVYQVTYQLDQPTSEDRRNLANLLGHVKRTWITDVLEHSVHETAMLELGMREEPGAVEHPWARVLEAPAVARRELPLEHSIAEVFDDVGRMLLILGEPGSGKTTTLLTLARECVRQAERDPMAPVPVVLSLSTWAESESSIREWLVGELATRYFVGPPLTRRWLGQSRLLLLLDGLDEVIEERRTDCVKAIHAFVKEHGVPGMVVCCRSRDYHALPVRMHLGGAVVLLPLAQEQVNAYLTAAGPELAELRSALERSAELRLLTESPLMLSIMTLAFRGAPPEALRFEDAATPTALRDRIFAVYVDRMFARRWRDRGPEARKQAQGWLHWLAATMTARGQSVFSPELLQASALTSTKQVLAYTLVSRVFATAILITIVHGLSGAAAASGARSSPTTFAKGIIPYLEMGLLAGIATGMLCFVTDSFRLLAPARGRVPPWKRMRVFIRFMLYALLGGIVSWFVAAVPIPGKGAFLDFSRDVLPVFLALPSGVAFAFFFGVRQGRGDVAADVSSAGVLRWQWKAALTKAAMGILLGLTAVNLFTLTLVALNILASWDDSLWPTSYAAGFGCVLGFLFGGWRFEIPPIDLQPRIQQSTRFRNALKGMLVSGSLGALAGGLLQLVLEPTTTTASALALAAIFASVAFSLIAFLWLGGIDLILQASLRVVIALSGVAPLRLWRFLDESVDLVFLQRAGGGYMFIHRLLLDHFAAHPVAGISAVRP